VPKRLTCGFRPLAALRSLTNLVKRARLGSMPDRKQSRRVRESVSLYEAKTHLSELVEEAAQGREIIIAKSGKPKARLVSLAPKDTRRLRKPGRGKGRGWIAPDFDAPLTPEILRLFTGESG
jgi:prevent-host-death family protein